MTTYTTIPDTDINPDKPIKSETAYALRDNPTAIAEGDPTAPSINPAALLIGGKGVDGILDDATPAFSSIGYYEFTSMSMAAARTIGLASIIRIAGNCTLSNVLSVTGRTSTITTAAVETQKLQETLHCWFGNDGGKTGGVGGGGGGGAGASGGFGSVGGAAKTLTDVSRWWVARRPILGGNGASTGTTFMGPGGGSVIIIIEGNFDASGGTIKANAVNDTSTCAGGAGGSIIIICTGTITNGTFEAKGGNANLGSNNHGGGAGGWIKLVASAYAGTQTMTVTGGTSDSGNTGSTGYSDKETLTRDQIRTLLQRM